MLLTFVLLIIQNDDFTTRPPTFNLSQKSEIFSFLIYFTESSKGLTPNHSQPLTDPEAYHPHPPSVFPDLRSFFPHLYSSVSLIHSTLCSLLRLLPVEGKPFSVEM